MIKNILILSLISLCSLCFSNEEVEDFYDEIAEIELEFTDFYREIEGIIGDADEENSETIPNYDAPTLEPYAPRKKSKKFKIRPTIEFKTGYFFFGESTMRNVFDRGGLDLQLCASYPLWKWFQLYGGIEYLRREGRSLHAKQKTRIWELPISLAIKTVVRIRKEIHYYLTLGPRYFFVFTHNSSPFMDKHLNQNGCGGFLGTGFNFFPLPRLFIDVFGEYSYCRLHFHPHKINTYGLSAQVGGYTFGAGIGYAF